MNKQKPISLFLVVPPQKGLLEGFSAGLISIANFVSDRNPDVNVQLLDYQYKSFDDVHNEIYEAVAPLQGRVIVGVTGTTASYQSMLEVAKIVKQINRTSIVLFGGHHVASQDDIVLEHHHDIVDLVARGEGERTVLKLLENIDNYKKVPGISYLEEDKLVRTASPTPLNQEELDSISPIFDERKDKLAGKFDFVTYVSARGCPLKCSFCVVRDSKIRGKNVDVIVDDLAKYLTEHNIKRIAIEDNFFAHQPRRTLELCEAISELRDEVDFEWDCQTRVESLRRKEIVNALKKAGCNAAYIGVEALAEEHLRFLGKTTKPEFYLSELKDTVIPNMIEADLGVYLNLQLGFRGESQSSRNKTLRRLKKLGSLVKKSGSELTVYPQLHVLYPGTPLFKNALETGTFGPDGESIFERFTQWEEAEEPIRKYLSLHFAHGVGGIPLGLLDPIKLAAGQFEIDQTSLIEVTNQLNQWETVEGVKVFKYGSYLAETENTHD